jgi:hypothetical protein
MRGVDGSLVDRPTGTAVSAHEPDPHNPASVPRRSVSWIIREPADAKKLFCMSAAIDSGITRLFTRYGVVIFRASRVNLPVLLKEPPWH